MTSDCTGPPRGLRLASMASDDWENLNAGGAPPMLSNQEARKFYNRFGKKQDWQSFYEDVATEALLRKGEFDKASGRRCGFQITCGFQIIDTKLFFW